MFALLKLPEVSRKNFFEAFFTIGGRSVSILLVVATTKFLTTFLSESAYGQLALYSITSTLPATFFFGPLGQGIMRYFPIAKEKNEMADFHRQYQQLFKNGSIVILSGGAILSLLCWFLGENKWALAILLIAPLNIINSANTFRYTLQNAARKRSLALGLEIGDRVLQQGLAILMLWLVSSDPLIVLVGYLISAILFALINHYYYYRSFPETKEFVQPAQAHGYYSRAILLYSWPFVVFGFFYWFQNASDRWALAILQSTEYVGQYAVLNQIGFQSQVMVLGSVSYFLLPILFNRAGSLQSSQQVENANQVNNWYLWLNVMLTSFLLLTFWLFSEEIILLLSDKKYIIIAKFLPCIVIAGGLFNFGQIYANRFMMMMETRRLMTPKITASIVGVILNFAGTYLYGLPGLIFSALFTQAIYLIMLILVWKSVKRLSTPPA